MKTLPNPHYYLDNFLHVLEWIASRYADLLNDSELARLSGFHVLPKASQALLVRMVMRKGRLFRSAKLAYAEIGCPHQAAQALAEAGWVDANPLLTLDDLYGLLKKEELANLLKAPRASAALKKAELLDALRNDYSHPMTFMQWQPDSREQVYALTVEVAALCERLRLMFFGNLHQDWTEFVLADLGIYQYEKVALDARSRGFRCRDDVDAYLQLHACRERFAAGEPAEVILGELGPPPDNDWLAGRRARFIFQIAQQHEQAGDLDRALALYQECHYSGARLRAIRVLERMNDAGAAYALAESALQTPENDEESQHLKRILTRLRRKLGLPRLPPSAATPIEELTLVLPVPRLSHSVEEEVRRHLHQPQAPVFYVENTLINSLFGLLCWDVIFQPVPGAFFHPFQTGPADLFSPDFRHRRAAQFEACFEQLQSGEYKSTIRQIFHAKAGIQSPFVFWEALSEPLLELALACIPPAHLYHWFMRLLQDLRANRNGFPDLIQFWPDQGCYRMIEVKGPGDRLQDNQIRMLQFAHAHGMAAVVCYVQWSGEAA